MARIEIIQSFMKDALIQYEKSNGGVLPEQIVVYRDGIGGPSLI